MSLTDTMEESINKRKRQPAVAAVLAFLGPGIGHLYCGNAPLAVGLAIVALAFVNVLFLLMIHTETERSTILVFLCAGCLIFLLQVAHAWLTARRQPNDFELRRYNHWYHYLIWWLAVAILVLFTGTIFGDFRSFRTPSASMENALFWGDRFIADMGAYETTGPARGDIAIFICPCDGTTLYVKRCVAVPGDTVEIINKRLYINGVPADESPTVHFSDTTTSGDSKIHERPASGVDSRDNYGPHVVPVGEFFMVGDNRDNSYDSRYWGFVPKNMFLGKALRIYYSSDWSRIGTRVNEL